MRLITPGSDANGPSRQCVGGRGLLVGGEGGRRALWRGRCLWRAGKNSVARGPRPRVVPPGRWWGGRTGHRPPPPPERAGPSFTEASRSAMRLSVGHFGCLGLSSPSAEEGRVTSILGEGGGAAPARRWGARLSHEENAAPLARRFSRKSTQRPGATRGGTLGQPGPAEGLVCLRGPSGSSGSCPYPGFCTGGTMAPHVENRARVECQCPPMAGGYLAGRRVGSFWVAPVGASWHTAVRGGLP